MDADILVESCEERMKLIRECISYKDPIGVKKLILEDKFNDETVHWELISILGECINKENFDICSPFVEVCERCMKYIINVGSPKELLLALLEQADGFGDSLKFSVFLQLIQKTLLMLKTKQVYSLELSLETISECLANLELPKDLDLEGEERRSHDLDPYVAKINEDIKNFLHFLLPFVNQVVESNAQGAENNEMGRQKVLLLKYLLKVLGHPFVYLDLSITEVNNKQVKSNTRLCLEHLMSYLVKLQPDLGELIEESAKKNADILRRKTMLAVESNENLMQDVVPMLALSCLSYLKHVEGFGNRDMSCLFTKQGIMEDNLKFVLFLVLKPESEVRRKGVMLFQHLLGLLSEDTQLCYEDLDRPEYFKILDSLFDIMIFSSVRDLREQCLKIVPGFIQVFGNEARYQIFLKLFGTQTHSGAYGYCVQLFKNQIEELLCGQHPGSKAFSLFTGLNLKRIFLLITRLPEGPATDLVENSDRIIAVLNFIRYLVLRDPCNKNLTGFWDFFPHIDKEFLTPMMTGLDMSKGHYRLEMTGLEEENTSRMTDGAQVEMSISVAGFKLPKMARGQKIAIFKQALNTLDLITSLLVRVNELIEQQKRRP